MNNHAAMQQDLQLGLRSVVARSPSFEAIGISLFSELTRFER